MAKYGEMAKFWRNGERWRNGENGEMAKWRKMAKLVKNDEKTAKTYEILDKLIIYLKEIHIKKL